MSRLLKLKEGPGSRILIRAANWVGDAIMTTPALRAVRRNFPQSRITVLAKPWVIPVYEHNPWVDEIMLYDAAGRHHQGPGVLRLARDIRRRRFHLAILMQNAFEAALLAFLAGIPERLGYNTDGRGLLLNRCVRLDPILKKRHLIEYYLGILKGAGLRTDGTGMDLCLTASDQAFAAELLEKKGFHEGMPVIGINPGATGGTAKRWFPERYAELAGLLARQYGTRILLFGGPGDHRLGETIASLSGGVCVNMAGKTTLGQAFALIRTLDLMVTNDSGLMHAAAALDIPQVALIGSTDPVATAPAGDRSVMLRIPTVCSPCRHKDCPGPHHICMDQIRTAQVFEICRTVLDPVADGSKGLNRV